MRISKTLGASCVLVMGVAAAQAGNPGTLGDHLSS